METIIGIPINNVQGMPILPCDRLAYMTLATRITLALDEKGCTQTAFADAIGASQPTVNDWRSGKTKTMRGDLLIKACAYLGVRAEWLSMGKGPMREFEPPQEGGNGMERGQDYVSGEAEQTAGIPKPTRQKMRFIDLYNGSASMGLGMVEPAAEYVAARIPVTDDWIRQNLRGITSPDNIRAVTAYGDSMSPTFSDGDVLFVDTAITDLSRDAVYVLEQAGKIFCKRVQRRLDGGWIVKSDNPAYEPMTVFDHQHDLFASLRVIGRVAGTWAWRGL